MYVCKRDQAYYNMCTTEWDESEYLHKFEKKVFNEPFLGSLNSVLETLYLA